MSVLRFSSSVTLLHSGRLSDDRSCGSFFVGGRGTSGRNHRQGSKQSQRNAAPVERSSEYEGTVQNTGSTSAARQRRIEKARTERERKEAGKKQQYPDWAKVLEAGVAEDPELRAILGDSLGNPAEMEKKAGEFMKSSPEEMVQVKNGSSTPMEVVIKDSDQFDIHLWMELYAPPTDAALEILGSVLRSWYMIGLLGGFNAASMQVTKTSLTGDPQYRWEEEEDSIPAMFHNCGDLEFQGNTGRVWVDMGTADSVAWDILINALQTVNSE